MKIPSKQLFRLWNPYRFNTWLISNILLTLISWQYRNQDWSVLLRSIWFSRPNCSSLLGAPLKNLVDCVKCRKKDSLKSFNAVIPYVFRFKSRLLQFQKKIGPTNNFCFLLVPRHITLVYICTYTCQTDYKLPCLIIFCPNKILLIINTHYYCIQFIT